MSDDLGTGVEDNGAIPCYGVDNLIPLYNGKINCTLRTRGALYLRPTIVVKNF